MSKMGEACQEIGDIFKKAREAQKEILEANKDQLRKEETAALLFTDAFTTLGIGKDLGIISRYTVGMTVEGKPWLFESTCKEPKDIVIMLTEIVMKYTGEDAEHVKILLDEIERLIKQWTTRRKKYGQNR